MIERKKDSDKYATQFCEDCPYLEECYYYEDGEFSIHPRLIEPTCGGMPMPGMDWA
jgi:hypothetical protein